MSTEVAVVRYGRLRQIDEFRSQGGLSLAPKLDYLVRTRRGIEVGRALAVVPKASAERVGEIVREATAPDLTRASDLRGLSDSEDLPKVRAALAARIELSVVACERLFDAEHTVIYYMSSERVDIPTLRGELEGLLATQVLLVHVGARKRARMCEGGCGVCGRTLCCSSFLRRLEPVTLRMAKVQGVDLSPRNTAGACGRLKCCLRFENPGYERAVQGLPTLGWEVRSPRVTGIVLAVDVLRAKVLVQPAEGSPRSVFAAEIEDMNHPHEKRLPTAGESSELPEAEIEPGWSQLAKRLWRRVNPRRTNAEGEE